MKTKLIAMAMVTLASFAMNWAASAQTISDIVGRGKVRIGVLIGGAPYGLMDSSGKPVGYDIDVAEIVAKYLGVPVEIVPLQSAARIPALESGKADFLVATLAPTPQRAKTVMFTIPYSGFQVGIYGPKTSKISQWSDLFGKKVGVNRGSSVEGDLLKHEKDGLQVVRFEDDATTMQALFSGQVDAVASPDTQADVAIRARKNDQVEQKFIFLKQANSMTVKKDAYELHQWLNNLIYFIKNNGELDVVSQKWLGKPLLELPTF